MQTKIEHVTAHVVVDKSLNCVQFFVTCNPEKEMATHSSVSAWKIPGTGEPGGLPSMDSHRVGHD